MNLRTEQELPHVTLSNQEEPARHSQGGDKDSRYEGESLVCVGGPSNPHFSDRACLLSTWATPALSSQTSPVRSRGCRRPVEPLLVTDWGFEAALKIAGFPWNHKPACVCKEASMASRVSSLAGDTSKMSQYCECLSHVTHTRSWFLQRNQTGCQRVDFRCYSGQTRSFWPCKRIHNTC